MTSNATKATVDATSTHNHRLSGSSTAGSDISRSTVGNVVEKNAKSGRIITTLPLANTQLDESIEIVEDQLSLEFKTSSVQSRSANWRKL